VIEVENGVPDVKLGWEEVGLISSTGRISDGAAVALGSSEQAVLSQGHYTVYVDQDPKFLSVPVDEYTLRIAPSSPSYLEGWKTTARTLSGGKDISSQAYGLDAYYI